MITAPTARVFLFLTLILAGLARAQSSGDAVSKPSTATSPSVLRIDGQDITADEYVNWMIDNMGDKQARVYALEQYVVERESRRLGISVTPEEIARMADSEVEERIQGAFFGRKEEWLKELARTGRSEEGIRRLRRVEAKPFLIARAIAAIDRVVPEEKVVRAWEGRYGRKGRKYDLLMLKLDVLLPTSSTDKDVVKAERDRVMSTVRERALRLRDRIAAGEDFGKVAREASEDPDTRDKRGVPSGGFSHFGWPRSFMDALERLAPGEVSEPLYARGGFWLVELRSVSVTPLDSVHKELEAELLASGPEQDEIGFVLTRLQENVQVKILPAMHEPTLAGELPAALEPALSIDGDLVTRGEFARWLVDTQGEAFVPRFLEEWSVVRKANELGLTVTEDEIAARTRAFVQWTIDTAYKKSREGWLAFLAVNHRTEDSYMRDLAGRMRIDALTEKVMTLDKKVTPAEVKSRYAEVYGENGDRIETRWIVLYIRTGEPDPSSTREQLETLMREASEAVRVRAAEITKKAREGADFAELAKLSSDDERTRVRGGLQSDRFRGDIYNDEIAAAVEALKPGEVTDPLLYGSVWVVFRCESRRRVTFEEAASELENELRTMRPIGTDINAYRNVLVKQLKVELLPGMMR